MEEKLTKYGIRSFLAPIRWIIVTGLVFFLASGEIIILRAWIYIVIYAIGGLIIGIMLLKKSPKLLNDRGKMQEGTKQFDKYVLLTYFLFAIVMTPFVAGIDRRLNLTELLPFFYLYIGIVLYIFSATFSIWPMLHNPFFEGTIRIQKEKNHNVINTGPYKIVRHPGYLGMLIGSISLPLALGSILAFIPLVIMIILIFIRTYYEDTTLQKELTGYSEYCKEVKYRLIPFIW
ncbi:MAG: isoprenylcysteine carboxylmethyltransferase family protein [Bacteroidales bacterium]|nr:MAG: isoprenylcysteine carboxylmethyltransferase family protein [Bacteroidales bacterium]